MDNLNLDCRIKNKLFLVLKQIEWYMKLYSVSYFHFKVPAFHSSFYFLLESRYKIFFYIFVFSLRYSSSFNDICSIGFPIKTKNLKVYVISYYFLI